MWVLWTRFDARRVYTEAEVNQMLKAWHIYGDHATLRRELINHQLMTRKSDCSEYRKRRSGRTTRRRGCCARCASARRPGGSRTGRRACCRRGRAGRRTMRDLTQGSIRGHLVAMALPITIGMLVQTLYLMVDLYFVVRPRQGGRRRRRRGRQRQMLVMALTQMLGVGTVSLVATRWAPGTSRARAACSSNRCCWAWPAWPRPRAGRWLAGRPTCAACRADAGHRAGRRHLHPVVAARPRAAVRAGRGGLRAARRRHRQAGDGGADWRPWA